MPNQVPFGIKVLPTCAGTNRNVSYRVFIFLFTFLIYTIYHLARKPISVVKNVLHSVNCTNQQHDHEGRSRSDNVSCHWAPFDADNYKILLGSMDYAFLFAYALGQFPSGYIADRVNVRYFLGFGMISTGILTAAFGLGYFLNIHSLAFYIVIQVLGGFAHATGFPSVISCMGHWFGKSKRGFIMGVWFSNVSVGNILGAVIAAIFVTPDWGWSFVVPGIMTACVGIFVLLFLVPEPQDVACRIPDHEEKMNETESFIDKVIGFKSVTVGTERTDQTSDSQPASDEFNLSEIRTPDSSNQHSSKVAASEKTKNEVSAISLWGALKIPGILEFSFCFFFVKLVGYSFMFWLPKYISEKTMFNAQVSANLSTLYDVGGILGGILAGLVSDFIRNRAITCFVMLLIAAPVMYVYDIFGSSSYATNVGLLMVCGFLIVGSYTLITTAVTADLGTHKSLQGNTKALATVTAIINGTGGIGAAIGPLLTGILAQSGWHNVFYMLIGADVMACLLLLRLVTKEIRQVCK